MNSTQFEVWVFCIGRGIVTIAARIYKIFIYSLRLIYSEMKKSQVAVIGSIVTIVLVSAVIGIVYLEQINIMDETGETEFEPKDPLRRVLNRGTPLDYTPENVKIPGVMDDSEQRVSLAGMQLFSELSYEQTKMLLAIGGYDYIFFLENDGGIISVEDVGDYLGWSLYGINGGDNHKYVYDIIEKYAEEISMFSRSVLVDEALGRGEAEAKVLVFQLGDNDNIDVDGDGYTSVIFEGDDCDDSDVTVNPGEEEQCIDGIDNNCNGVFDCYDDDCEDSSYCHCTDSDDDGYGDRLGNYGTMYNCLYNDPDCDDSDPLVLGCYHVFVSSIKYSAQMGGLDAANQVCKGMGDFAGIGGRWMAWLSTEGNPISERFYHSDHPYVLLNGRTVADNWIDLYGYDGEDYLNGPISRDEFGEKFKDGGDHYVWTVTADNGLPINDDCNGWSMGEIYSGTVLGNSKRENQEWTAGYLGDCQYEAAHLYCFEQPPCEYGAVEEDLEGERGPLSGCSDEIDNDCDGLVDCADSDCAHNPRCICDDSDGDGYGTVEVLTCSHQEIDCDDDTSDDPSHCTDFAGGCLASYDYSMALCAACIFPNNRYDDCDGVDNDCDPSTLDGSRPSIMYSLVPGCSMSCINGSIYIECDDPTKTGFLQEHHLESGGDEDKDDPVTDIIQDSSGEDTGDEDLLAEPIVLE